MKKLIPGILAVTIALSLSAFTLQKPDSGNQQTYRFASTDAAGNVDALPDVYIGTIPDARTHYDCQEGNTVYCAVEVNNSNQPITNGLELKKP